ncbi:MAG: signal recognition particle receptor subunit alpha, partial [Chitinophagaceae bacterium]
MGFFDKLFGKKEKEQLEKGLEKTREGFFSKITKAIAGKSQVDEEVLDQLEEALITADVGVDTTVQIIEKIEARVARDKYMGTDELHQMLKDEIRNILVEDEKDTLKKFELPENKKPFVVLVVGVNGVGKTTTIGKLAT